MDYRTMAIVTVSILGRSEARADPLYLPVFHPTPDIKVSHPSIC